MKFTENLLDNTQSSILVNLSSQNKDSIRMKFASGVQLPYMKKE